MYMFQDWDTFVSYLQVLAIPLLSLIFFVVSLILFIRDGKKSKLEGRKRKTYPIVLFVVSLVIFVILTLLVTAFFIIGYLVMKNM